MCIDTLKNIFSMKRVLQGFLGNIEKCVGFVRIVFFKFKNSQVKNCPSFVQDVRVFMCIVNFKNSFQNEKGLQGFLCNLKKCVGFVGIFFKGGYKLKSRK